MIKLPTAISLLVKVSEPLVSSHELNLNEIFLVLLVIYFSLNLSTMLEFCGMGTRLKIKKKQKKHVSRPSTKDADGNISF